MRTFIVAAFVLIAGAVLPGPQAQGRIERGRLSSADDSLDSGEFSDRYTFSGRPGQRVRLDVASEDFDTYLIVTGPDGDQEENDDAGEDSTDSAIDLRLTGAGTYEVIVTSYKQGETGRYKLRITFDVAAGRSARSNPRRPDGRGSRIFGIFVGISDYPEAGDFLEYTAADARGIRDALLDGAGMDANDSRVLTDRQATIANVRRAFEDVARQAGPSDTFTFFFSGHGDRVRRTSRQTSDPDDFDETISLYDGDITDDELNSWFGNIRAGVSLVALDSCFSGGFSKDVISAPGRMGLFSSEEDVTSGVAVNFHAGGYLATFIAQGVGQQRADENRDGEITAIELSEYLHERYRADVKSRGSDEASIVTTDRARYQHLVVDRGGISPHDVLFRR